MSALKRIEDLAEELQAILLLEFHNKNHLSLGLEPARLNKSKRSLVSAIIAEAKGDKG